MLIKRNYQIFLKIYLKKNKLIQYQKIPPKKLEEEMTGSEVQDASDDFFKVIKA